MVLYLKRTIVQRLVTIDFGLGSFLKRGGELYRNDAEEVVGTPNYSSPQVIDADNAGKPGDNHANQHQGRRRSRDTTG